MTIHHARMCRARYHDPLGAIHATCILDEQTRIGPRVVDHVGPHWGPIDEDPDRMHEWDDNR